MEKIVRNSVKCLLCDTEIESKHVHDFAWCPCGNVAVDGGQEYLKRAWTNPGDTWTDTSIIKED